MSVFTGQTTPAAGGHRREDGWRSGRWSPAASAGSPAVRPGGVLSSCFAASVTIDSLLGGDPDALAAVVGGPATGPVPPDSSVVVPGGGQGVWAAGVAYKRSLDARVARAEVRRLMARIPGPGRRR